MERSIDMRVMRYITLFSKVSHVSTTNCFDYNNQIIFAVPRSQISIAIGKNASNVKKLREILGKKIRVVALPAEQSTTALSKFISEVVDPVEFTKVEIKNGLLTITAGRQSKAALIGRNRIREKELGSIMKDFFGIGRVRVA